MPACPFPITWSPLVWEIHLAGWSPSSAQDHVAKPDWPGCLLPFMKIWFRINKLSVLLYFPACLSCRLLIVCWWSNTSCWLATAPLWFAYPVAEPVLLCTGEKNPSSESKRWTASGVANVWLIVHSVGSKDQIFQRMLGEMKTFCSVFSFLKVYWDSWRVQRYLVQ